MEGPIELEGLFADDKKNTLYLYTVFQVYLLHV